LEGQFGFEKQASLASAREVRFPAWRPLKERHRTALLVANADRFRETLF